MARIGTPLIRSKAAAGTGGTPGGTNTQVQFNDAGAFGGATNLLWKSGTLVLGNANLTDNVSSELVVKSAGIQTNGAIYPAVGSSWDLGQNGGFYWNAAYISDGGINLKGGTTTGFLGIDNDKFYMLHDTGKLAFGVNGGTQATWDVAGLTVNRTFTYPDVSGTLVTNNGTQTLTNKTVNNPVIGTPAITGGTATSTVLNSNTVGTPAITGGTALSIVLGGTPTLSSLLNANSNKITNVTDPTSAQDASTKAYVDTVAQGLDAKPSAIVATTAGLPTYTYSNGASGLGATITAVATGVVAVDGRNLALNDVVLVKNETVANAPYNGLYTVTVAGAVGVALVLTRHTSMDTTTEYTGAFIFVETGTVNAAAGFVCTNSVDPTVGTTDISFTQFSGAGEITAGDGLTKTGNTLNVGAGTAISITADAVNVDTGTVPLKSDTLAVFAPTTSAQLGSVISDETGSGKVVFANSPTLGTPTITTYISTGTVVMATGGGTLATLAGTETLTNKTINNSTVGTPAVTGGTANAITLGTPIIASFASGTHSHQDAAGGGAIIVTSMGTLLPSVAGTITGNAWGTIGNGTNLFTTLSAPGTNYNVLVSVVIPALSAPTPASNGIFSISNNGTIVTGAGTNEGLNYIRPNSGGTAPGFTNASYQFLFSGIGTAIGTYTAVARSTAGSLTFPASGLAIPIITAVGYPK